MAQQHAPELFVAFLGGALMGCGAALLVAPKPGRETREDLRKYARRVEDEVVSTMRGIQAALEGCQQACQDHLTRCKEQMKGEETKTCCD